MEGPMDSGISLNGDTISSPDSDNSSQHHIQNQTVSVPFHTFSQIFNIAQPNPMKTNWIRSAMIKIRTTIFQDWLIDLLHIFFGINLKKQDIETRKSKRGHVLGELLETERIYVAEMGSILRVCKIENIEKHLLLFNSNGEENFVYTHISYALFMLCNLSRIHVFNYNAICTWHWDVQKKPCDRVNHFIDQSRRPTVRPIPFFLLLLCF